MKSGGREDRVVLTSTIVATAETIIATVITLKLRRG
jgi:hypothetical protein